MPDTPAVKWIPWKMLGISNVPEHWIVRTLSSCPTPYVEVQEDLFAPNVAISQQDSAFAVMAACTGIVFRVMTRFPAAARAFLADLPKRRDDFDCHSGLDSCEWPLRNVWLLLRASTQADLEQGVPDLLQTPAAVRGVLLDGPVGELDLTMIYGKTVEHDGTTEHWINALTGAFGDEENGTIDETGPHLDWVALRGQTGPEAKPLRPDIVLTVRDQCRESSAPFSFEGWGEWSPAPQGGTAATLVHDWPGGEHSFRVGADVAGRLIDGEVWDQIPEAPHA